MQQIIIKESALGEKIDFTPTIIFAFYTQHKQDSFIQTAQKIEDLFGDIALIACSSGDNIIGEVPYRSDETVLCLMDLKTDAFTLLFSKREGKEFSFPLSWHEKNKNALIFYAGDEVWMQKNFDSLHHQLDGGGLFGAVVGTLSSDRRGGSLYYKGLFHEDALFCCLIDSDMYNLQGTSLHDFQPAGIELIVTASEENKILQIEDEPALSMIERSIGVITKKRMSMFDTPFFVKDAALSEDEPFSLTSLQKIDRYTGALYMSRRIEVGTKLKVAIPISNRTMKKRLWSVRNNFRVTNDKEAMMFLLSSSSLPSHWQEMETLYIMSMICHIKLPFIGMHTYSEIAPSVSQNKSTLKNQTLTVVSLSEKGVDR